MFTSSKINVRCICQLNSNDRNCKWFLSVFISYFILIIDFHTEHHWSSIFIIDVWDIRMTALFHEILIITFRGVLIIAFSETFVITLLHAIIIIIKIASFHTFHLITFFKNWTIIFVHMTRWVILTSKVSVNINHRVIAVSKIIRHKKKI